LNFLKVSIWKKLTASRDTLKNSAAVEKRSFTFPETSGGRNLTTGRKQQLIGLLPTLESRSVGQPGNAEDQTEAKKWANGLAKKKWPGGMGGLDPATR